MSLFTAARTRVPVSLAVLCAVGAALGAFGAGLYAVGKRLEDDRVFLKNDRSPNEYETEISIKMGYAMGSHEPNDVIFLGDSGSYLGISPAQFKERTGLTAYNLGIPGIIGLKPVQLVLNRYLENHPKPRAVVVCCAPNRLEETQNHWDFYQKLFWCYGRGDEARRPTHVNRREAIREYTRAGGRYVWGELTGGRAPHLDEVIQGFSHPDATYNKIAQDRERERGFHALGAHSWKKDPFQEYPDPDPFTVNAENRRTFEDLVRECEGNGIALIVRFSPYYERAAPADWSELQSWTDGLAKAHPSIVVSEPIVLLYPKEWMADTRHCAATGVRHLTALVADEVKRALAKCPPG